MSTHSPWWCVSAALLLVLLAVSGDVRMADAKLVQAQVLVRHGNRAPNPELIKSCPKLFPSLQYIYDTFGVRPQELTRAGLNQCFIVGDMLREEYVVKQKLMRPEYTPDSVEWYFQARGETRHQQSIAAITQALFPAGSGLSTYPDRLQPVPFFSWDKSLDSVLHPPKLCQACRYRDDARWSANKGQSVVDANPAKVETISRLCGFNITSARVPSAALKDIADGFGFLTYEGLSIKGMADWSAVNQMVTQFSFDMFVDRLFGTPEQATYWAGDYPRNLAANMLQMVQRRLDDRGEPARKFAVFTASRELLFGVEFFFGLKFDIPDRNTPKGAMPPGDAIVFELHSDADTVDDHDDDDTDDEREALVAVKVDGEVAANTKAKSKAKSKAAKRPAVAADADAAAPKYFVRVWNMFPPTNDANAALKHKQPYTRQLYTIAGCAEDCPLEQFIALIRAREAATGSWQDICSRYTFADLAREFPTKFGAGKPPGKHTPEADAIGPPPGVHDRLSRRYIRSDAAPTPYDALSLKPLGSVVKPPSTKALTAGADENVKVKSKPKRTAGSAGAGAAAVDAAAVDAAAVDAAAVDVAAAPLTLEQYVLRVIEETPWTPAEYATHVLGTDNEMDTAMDTAMDSAMGVANPSESASTASTAQHTATQLEGKATHSGTHAERPTSDHTAADAPTFSSVSNARDRPTDASLPTATDGDGDSTYSASPAPAAATSDADASSGWSAAMKFGAVLLGCALIAGGVVLYKRHNDRVNGDAYEPVGMHERA